MMNYLKPTKKRVIVSLIPLYILLSPFLLFLLLDIIPPLLLTPIGAFAIIYGLLIFYIYGATIGAPIERMLEKMGLVNHYGSMFDINLPDISFLGIIVTGLLCSLILYFIISVIGWKIGGRKGNVKKKKMGKK